MVWFEDANTTRETPAWRAASKTLYVPTMLLCRTSSQGVSSDAEAARWTTASTFSNAGRIASRSAMSATWLGNSCGVSVRDVSSYRSAEVLPHRRADRPLCAGDEDAARSHQLPRASAVQRLTSSPAGAASARWNDSPAQRFSTSGSPAARAAARSGLVR